MNIETVFNYFHSPIEEKTILGEMQTDFEKPEGFWDLVVSPISKVLSWADFFFGRLYYPLRECKSLVGRVRTFERILNLPDKLDRAVETLTELKNTLLGGISWELGAKTRDAYIETAGSISLMADSIELGKDAGLWTLSAGQILLLDLVGFMGSLSLFLSSCKDFLEHGHDFLFKETGSPEFNFAVLKLAGKILLIAMSILGMATFATGGVSNRLVLLSLSTVTLLLSTVSKYYKRAHIKT